MYPMGDFLCEISGFQKKQRFVAVEKYKEQKTTKKMEKHVVRLSILLFFLLIK